MQTDAPEKRRCSRTKRDGNPCGAWAVRGKDACPGHLGLGLAADPSASARKGNASRREAGERRREARRMTLQDHLAAAAAEHAAELVAAYRRGWLADDAGTAFRAAEAFLSRMLGRPTERVETREITPDDLETLTLDEIEAELRKLDEL
jgi:hypothetical protein